MHFFTDDESDESKNKLKHHILEGLFSFPQPSWKNISEEGKSLQRLKESTCRNN